MRSRLVIAVVALALAAVAAVQRPAADSGLRLVGARGAMAMVNSREGGAILRVPRIAPGETHGGSVTVRNAGRATVRLYLASGKPAGAPGPGGGSLAERLRLTVADKRGVVAHGTLAGVAGCHDLGVAAPGETRTYVFSVQMPDGGSRDNRYEGSTASVDETWRATAPGGGCVRGRQEMRAERATHPPPRGGGPEGRPEAGDGTLPFTGLSALVLAGAGLVLVLLGRATRRRVRR